MCLPLPACSSVLMAREPIRDCVNSDSHKQGSPGHRLAAGTAHGAPAWPPRPARGSVVKQALGEVVGLAAALGRRGLPAPAPVALVVVLLADVVVGHRRRARRVLPRARVLPRGAPTSDPGLSRYRSVTGAAPRTCAGRLVSPLGDTRPAVFRARPRPSMHHQRDSPLAHTHACREVSGRAGGEGREACAPAGRPAASAQRAAHPCAPPRPAAPPPGGRRCAARAAGTARPPRRPPGPPAGSRRPAPRAPRGVARHGAGGDIGHHAEVSLLCP